IENAVLARLRRAARDGFVAERDPLALGETSDMNAEGDLLPFFPRHDDAAARVDGDGGAVGAGVFAGQGAQGSAEGLPGAAAPAPHVHVLRLPLGAALAPSEHG